MQRASGGCVVPATGYSERPVRDHGLERPRLLTVVAATLGAPYGRRGVESALNTTGHRQPGGVQIPRAVSITGTLVAQEASSGATESA